LVVVSGQKKRKKKERENPFSLSLRTLLWVVVQRNGHPGDIIDDLTSGSCMHGVTLVTLGLKVSKIHFLMGMRDHTTGQLGVPSDTRRGGFLGSTALQGRCSGIK
jgi:hypothetical protein